MEEGKVKADIARKIKTFKIKQKMLQNQTNVSIEEIKYEKNTKTY